MAEGEPKLQFSEQQQCDEHWMQRALVLADKSVGLASPNPAVGCVLVRNNRAVGEGFHTYDLRDHAEVVALRDAGSSAKGSTAYVTLEPCSHTGRTGPCANALIEAGIARVVVATGDPNPAVNGYGVERLREAGIQADVGLLSEEARELNDGFACYIRTHLPFVTLKAAISMDGGIAPDPKSRTARAPFMLTGPESQAEVQRMRHASDAVITGIGTILADDPLLTDRSGLPRRRPLLRVVLDSHLRLPLDFRAVQTANNDVLVFCVSPDPERWRELAAAGVRIEQVEAEAGGNRVSLKRVLERLGEMEITSVMLEVGSQLSATALDGCVDKLTLFHAPVYLGSDAVPFVGKVPNKPVRIRASSFGSDACFNVWLRDPWAAECLNADR